jgi:hypothetical protein
MRKAPHEKRNKNTLAYKRYGAEEVLLLLRHINATLKLMMLIQTISISPRSKNDLRKIPSENPTTPI